MRLHNNRCVFGLPAYDGSNKILRFENFLDMIKHLFVDNRDPKYIKIMVTQKYQL
jgi:hypothetical protein